MERIRVLAFVVALLVAGFWAGAAGSAPAEIVATSLRIVDAKGRPTIILGATDSGPMVALLHEGKLRVAFNAQSDVASIELYGAGGQESHVELRVDEKDNPTLLLIDPHNVVRMQIAVNRDGDPNIKLLDERKRPRAIWGMTEEGDAALALFDRGGNVVGGAYPTKR